MNQNKAFLTVLSIFFTAFQPLTAQWLPVGLPIMGDSATAFGAKLSFSADGNRLAVSSPYADHPTSNSGSVNVYEWDNNTWAQLGSTLNGASVDELFGREVKISGDGKHLAVGYKNYFSNQFGRVKVFQFINGDWQQLGQNLNGTQVGEQFGNSVALSFDGMRMAVGAPGANANGSKSGRFLMYEFNGTSWVQRGGAINGLAAQILQGATVALSDDGNTVVGGALPLDDNNGNARVFTFDGTNWIPKGAVLTGPGRYGYGVDLSADGNRLAVSGYLYPTSYYGHVQVFEYINDNWEQVGSNITGQFPADYAGFVVELSADGTTLATGSPGYDGSTSNIGLVQVFNFQSDNWFQISQNFEGPLEQDSYGNTLALSGNGKRIACSSTGNNGVVVYENPVVNTTDPGDISVRVFPNPTTGRFEIDFKDMTPLQWQILDLHGSIAGENTTDISTLPDGMYLLRIITTQGIILKKLLKHAAFAH